MNKNGVLSMLGLAAKAGQVVSGEFSTEKAIQSGKAGCVLVAADASENTRKLFRNKTAHYHIPYFECYTKEELGRAIGKEQRASLAITEDHLSQAIIKKIADTDTNTEVGNRWQK